MLFSIYSIGFMLSSQESLNNYISQALHRGERRFARSGSYAVWTARCGAELWVKLAEDNSVLGINPYFSGNASMQAGLLTAVPDLSSGSLDGGFTALAGARPVDSGSNQIPFEGDYQFTFNTPNFASYQGLALPCIQSLRLTGIARELGGFKDEDQFRGWQTGLGRTSNPESFLPPPTPDGWAEFSGLVLDAARLTNDLTGAPFWWAWVRTLGGEIDVVCHPDNLRGELIPGGICSGSIWLTGKLLL
jgi:hypothetical protein